MLTDFLESAEQILPGGVRVVRRPEQRERWLAEELARGRYALLGFIDHRAYYGAHYLQDLVNASRYAPDAAILAKALGETEFAYDGEAAGAGCLIRVEAFLKHSPGAHENLPHDLPAGLRVYCADRDEFIAPTA